MGLKTQALIGNDLIPKFAALTKYVPPAKMEQQALKEAVRNPGATPTISQILKSTGAAMLDRSA